jgi:hypothetical protein
MSDNVVPCFSLLLLCLGRYISRATYVALGSDSKEFRARFTRAKEKTSVDGCRTSVCFASDLDGTDNRVSLELSSDGERWAPICAFVSDHTRSRVKNGYLVLGPSGRGYTYSDVYFEILSNTLSDKCQDIGVLLKTPNHAYPCTLAQLQLSKTLKQGLYNNEGQKWVKFDDAYNMLNYGISYFLGNFGAASGDDAKMRVLHKCVFATPPPKSMSPDEHFFKLFLTAVELKLEDLVDYQRRYFHNALQLPTREAVQQLFKINLEQLQAFTALDEEEIAMEAAWDAHSELPNLGVARPEPACSAPDTRQANTLNSNFANIYCFVSHYIH